MNRLKFLREEKNMLQEDIGRVINVSARTISNYETENRKMSPDIIIKLANFFNVSIEYLLGTTDNRYPNSYENDLLELAKVGFTRENYEPPTEKQKEQIRAIIETILQDNKKDNKKDDKNK